MAAKKEKKEREEIKSALHFNSFPAIERIFSHLRDNTSLPLTGIFWLSLFSLLYGRSHF